MIFLQLFYTFFKIGLFGFGGGYAMMSVNSLELSHSWRVTTSPWIIEIMAYPPPNPKSPILKNV